MNRINFRDPVPGTGGHSFACSRRHTSRPSAGGGGHDSRCSRPRFHCVCWFEPIGHPESTAGLATTPLLSTCTHPPLLEDGFLCLYLVPCRYGGRPAGLGDAFLNPTPWCLSAPRSSFFRRPATTRHPSTAWSRGKDIAISQLRFLVSGGQRRERTSCARP